MSDALDLGLGMSSTSRPGREDVARVLDREASTIFSLEESRDAARRGRAMGGGASDTRLMDVTCIRLARDIVAILTDEEFERLLAKARRRKEAA